MLNETVEAPDPDEPTPDTPDQPDIEEGEGTAPEDE